MYPSPSSIAFATEPPVWFLKERVIVAWQDDDHDRTLHLGEPSPLNKDTSLVLWLGIHEANNHAVAMLQLTVTHYVKAKRKKFDIFSMPTSLHFADLAPILSIDEMPIHVSRMFEDIEGSSRSRFLRLSLQKTVPSQTLMPIRKTARHVQGAAEHVMLSAKTFSESVEVFDIYMGYSTYAHQALENRMAVLKTKYAPPDIQLAFSYNHNGGAFNSWDDYLDTAHPRKATDIDLVPNRHAHKRRRIGYHRGEEKDQGEEEGEREEKDQGVDIQGSRAEEEEAPPAYTKACTQVQVPASDCALSPHSVRCRDGTIVPTTPPNQSSRALLDPLDTPASLPPGPPLSPHGDPLRIDPLHVGPPQHAPLDARFLPLTNDRSDVPVALREAFVTWLFSMGKLRPHVYEDPELYNMLVAFGLAINRCDVARFPNIKSRATSLVLKLHVTTSMPRVRDWSSPAERHVQRLVRWMCGYVLHADEVMIDDLLLLTQKAVDLAEQDQASREEYLLQEATCIANFFVRYAQPLLRYLER
ncbi:hypothetical protein VTO58DRAFT_101399 [Aureobasidium pullulans]|nr:hypothetical protein JADG_006766 [Aureobasidium pullulans]